jgi:thiamine biosynthesis lipoprotein
MIDERSSMDQRAPVTRRRLLTIAAAAAGCAAIGLRPARAGAVASYTWHGVALGANASLTLQHPDESAAKAAIASCLDEVARLENVFSLHRADSALSRLNAQGTLTDAPNDLRRLLADALRLASQTAGRFDPTIQPLWQCYAEHFARNPQDAAGPALAQLDAARALVDWRGVEITGSTIRLARQGMAVSLNGMAQGYITDRVGDLLRGAGFTHVLVNMGEQLAIGPKWNGESWSIAITDPGDSTRTLASLTTSEGALATSSPRGFAFDTQGRYTHILDVRAGKPSEAFTSVSVLAESAAYADGLSTAIAASPADTDWSHIPGSTRVLVQTASGSPARWL